MSVQIPMPYRDTASTFALVTWVTGKKCNRNKYYHSIELFKADLVDHFPDREPNPEAIVIMLAAELMNEDDLQDYVIANGNEIPDDGRWLRIAMAAGWALLRKYDQDQAGRK